MTGEATSASWTWGVPHPISTSATGSPAVARAAGPLHDAACAVFARSGFERSATDARQLSESEVLLCHFEGPQGAASRVDGVLWGRLQSAMDFAPAGLGPPFAWVNLVAVDEDRRRRGVGRALLAAFANQARRRGATFLGLEAFPPNRRDPLHSFYRSCGLAEFGPCDGHDRLGQPL